MQLNKEFKLVVFPTDLGWVGILHFNHMIELILTGHPGQTELLEALPSIDFDVTGWDLAEKEWVDRFQQFASGVPVCFDSLELNLGRVTEFQRLALNRCRKIPYGKTISYGELGAMVGAPRAARAVGSVMKKNRHPWVIPCHRVVSQNGIGGFSSPRGVELKRQLLDLEGYSGGTQNQSDGFAEG